MSKMQETLFLRQRMLSITIRRIKAKSLDDISYGFEIGKCMPFWDQVVPVRQLFYRFWQVWILRRMGEFIMKG